MFSFIVKSLLQSLRRYRLQFLGASIEKPQMLSAGIDCRAGYGKNAKGNIEIAAAAWIEPGVILHAYGGSIRIGREVFLGPYTVIYGHGSVTIGDATLISMHCRILSSNHTVPPLDRHIRWEPDVLQPTRIGRDVWLGAGVTVLGGVTIGDGCVVGAGSVVTKDLPAGAIAYGVPAEIKRYRNASS